MKIAICEDNKKDRNTIATILEAYLLRNGITADIDYFENSSKFLANFAVGKYQIIFLDIFTGKGLPTGMETAEKIHKLDKSAAIIFVTTSADYGIEGYNYGIYYILKPATPQAVEKAMQKCHTQVELYGKSIEIIVNRMPMQLKLHNIYYVEARQRQCIFVTKQGVFPTNITLDRVAAALLGKQFIKCHRSFIVNMAHADDLMGKDFIVAGTHIPISKSAFADVVKEFNSFLANELLNK